MELLYVGSFFPGFLLLPVPVVPGSGHGVFQVVSPGLRARGLCRIVWIVVYSGLVAIRMNEPIAVFSSRSLIGVKKASTSSAGLEVALKAPVMIRAALYCTELSFSTFVVIYLPLSAVGANHTVQP